MNIVDYYYHAIGESATNEDLTITNNTINYLKDNNFSDIKIIQIIDSMPFKKAFAVDDLPDVLWDNSLLKRNTYYYHNQLHITSKPPMWSSKLNKMTSEKFYIEMKIEYTINDLLEYFYKTFPTNINLRNKNKDIGSINYLLTEYEKITFIKSVDFILFLIDEAKNQNITITEIFDIKKTQADVYKYLEIKTTSAKAEKKNLIMWRS